MKPTSPILKTAAKRPAKRRPAKHKKAYRADSIIGKLLKLKYRINDAYRGGNKPSNGDTETRHDKSYIIKLIEDVRNNNITKLSHEDGTKCNAMWKQYN